MGAFAELAPFKPPADTSGSRDLETCESRHLKGNKAPQGIRAEVRRKLERGEFETATKRANSRKYWPTTQTGRRSKVSACWYNRRVKQSLISLCQLRETHSPRTQGRDSSFENRDKEQQKYNFRIGDPNSPGVRATSKLGFESRCCYGESVVWTHPLLIRRFTPGVSRTDD